MKDRRALVLDAAIRVLADQGPRALTHRTVDRTAGLPQGSTSNLYRTRATLVAGVLRRVGEREQDVLAGVWPASSPGSVDELAAALAAMLDRAVAEGRELTLTRCALSQEAAHDTEVSEALATATESWWSLLADWLDRLAVDDAATRARWLFAFVEGLIEEALARPDHTFDMRGALRAAVVGVTTS